MTEIDRNRMIRDNRRICIQMERCANSSLAREGITAVQAHILLYILNHSDQGTSLTAIHREFGYSMAALSGMLKRLREKGYVRVEHCAGDDRCKLLFGTEQGEQIRESLDRAICSVQGRLYDCFSPEELRMLDRLQTKMLQNLSELTQHTKKEETTS